MESGWQRLYREDGRVLGELGAALARAAIPRFEVRLPRPLAELALAAWKRDGDEGPGEPESYEQRVQRHRAGALALIGLGVEERGRWDGEEVVVDLSAELIGVALDAADDLAAPQPPSSVIQRPA
jgi:hypothetical protein